VNVVPTISFFVFCLRKPPKLLPTQAEDAARVRLTTHRYGDIARDRKKGCLIFLYVWVARISLEQTEMSDARDRVVMTKAAIEVIIGLP